MPRSRLVLFLALIWQVSARAECPPRRDAELLAAGGAIVSGRIIEVGAPASAPGVRHPTWALLAVAERHAGEAPPVVRLLAAKAGLYTPIFTVGQAVTFAVRRPFSESAVTICDARQPVAGNPRGR